MKNKGFTLIELLIVIAIILILIAIALPNFLEAQLRAKSTKAKAEIRTLAIAMEEYFLDWKFYPAESEPDIFSRSRSESGLEWLTSPVAYISTVPEDPFNDSGNQIEYNAYETGGTEEGFGKFPCPMCMATWVIFTRGPDFSENEILSAEPMSGTRPPDNIIDSYNPTNGTKSNGDIFQFGGDSFWIGVTLGSANRSIYNAGVHDRGLPVNGRVYLHTMPLPLQ